MFATMLRRPVWAAVVIASTVFSLSSTSRANHGPGASGGGSATISGETLKQGHFELSIREDFTQFERFDTDAAVGRAKQGGSFDALDHGFITTAGLSFGVFDDFELDLSVGYFVGNDFISADQEDDGSIAVSRTNPRGLTDLVLTGKYRVLKGAPGNLSLIAGVVFPTGEDGQRLQNGESLSPTDQPGTGRWGLPVGLAYSRFLTSHLTIDASALYTFRFERADFKVGDRLDVGVALAYRLTDSIKQFPQFSVFGELNDVYLQKDSENGTPDDNSGSNTMYVTPGLRVRFEPHTALTVAPSFPAWEEFNGNQGRVDYKIAITFSLSF